MKQLLFIFIYLILATLNGKAQVDRPKSISLLVNKELNIIYFKTETDSFNLIDSNGKMQHKWIRNNEFNYTDFFATNEDFTSPFLKIKSSIINNIDTFFADSTFYNIYSDKQGYLFISDSNNTLFVTDAKISFQSWGYCVKSKTSPQKVILYISKNKNYERDIQLKQHMFLTILIRDFEYIDNKGYNFYENGTFLNSRKCGIWDYHEIKCNNDILYRQNFYRNNIVDSSLQWSCIDDSCCHQIYLRHQYYFDYKSRIAYMLGYDTNGKLIGKRLFKIPKKQIGILYYGPDESIYKYKIRRNYPPTSKFYHF